MDIKNLSAMETKAAIYDATSEIVSKQNLLSELNNHLKEVNSVTETTQEKPMENPEQESVEQSVQETGINEQPVSQA